MSETKTDVYTSSTIESSMVTASSSYTPLAASTSTTKPNPVTDLTTLNVSAVTNDPSFTTRNFVELSRSVTKKSIPLNAKTTLIVKEYFRCETDWKRNAVQLEFCKDRKMLNVEEEILIHMDKVTKSLYSLNRTAYIGNFTTFLIPNGKHVTPQYFIDLCKEKTTNLLGEKGEACQMSESTTKPTLLSELSSATTPNTVTKVSKPITFETETDVRSLPK